MGTVQLQGPLIDVAAQLGGVVLALLVSLLGQPSDLILGGLGADGVQPSFFLHCHVQLRG